MYVGGGIACFIPGCPGSPAVLDHAGALAQGDNGIGPDLLRLILFQLCYPFRDEAIQLSVGECLQPWTILFLNHSHGKR
jgi:hypothetical protein